MSHLDVLEAESIHVIREVVAEIERPVLLFSGGKDSIVMLCLAERAFHPAPVPFPLLHVDTGHNFPEGIDFRDRLVADRVQVTSRMLVPADQPSGRQSRPRWQPLPYRHEPTPAPTAVAARRRGVP